MYVKQKYGVGLVTQNGQSEAAVKSKSRNGRNGRNDTETCYHLLPSTSKRGVGGVGATAGQSGLRLPMVRKSRVQKPIEK